MKGEREWQCEDGKRPLAAEGFDLPTPPKGAALKCPVPNAGTEGISTTTCLSPGAVRSPSLVLQPPAQCTLGLPHCRG